MVQMAEAWLLSVSSEAVEQEGDKLTSLISLSVCPSAYTRSEESLANPTYPQHSLPVGGLCPRPSTRVPEPRALLRGGPQPPGGACSPGSRGAQQGFQSEGGKK